MYKGKIRIERNEGKGSRHMLETGRPQYREPRVDFEMANPRVTECEKKGMIVYKDLPAVGFG